MLGMRGFTKSNGAARHEGPVAKALEERTSKIPSDVFMWGAFGCMAASVILQMSGKRHQSLFVGEWVPTLLIFGLYNKLVKQLGSDRSGFMGIGHA